MPIKKYRPTSPGRRFMSVSAFDEVTTTKTVSYTHLTLPTICSV